ncbi:MAG: DUF2946 domain-containing protein [Burkholderiales bacterium]|uniref:DUF2946 family protein n=1 Tax=Roseateles sp. TaxID=1971397 RepID=UPI000F9B951E|nr:MAG: DUF2946 domain-containing protein [Burkholderiales bacterium]
MNAALARLRKRQPLLLALLVLCMLCVQGTAAYTSARMALAGLGAGVADICSSNGSRRLSSAADTNADKPAAPESAGSHAACWACVLTAQGMAPPPVLQPPRTQPAPSLHTTAARVCSAALRPLPAPGAPRAPPQTA